MADSQRWIHKHWSRLQWGQFLGSLGDHLSTTLLVVGCVVLVARLLYPPMWPYLASLSLLGILVPYLSWKSSQRRSFSEQEATALLDQKINAGGLLMTLAEAPDEEWKQRLPLLEQLWRDSLPKIRPRRFASLVAFPLMFAIISCLVPIREFSEVIAKPHHVAKKTSEELESIMETLEEAEVLEEEEEKELKEELEKFIEETKNQPLTHEQWETADSLRQQMQLSWSQNERSLQSASSAVEELLSELANQGELSAERLSELEKSLGQNLKTLASKACNGSCPGLSEEMKEKLKAMAESGQLKMPGDAGERQKMLNELKEMLKKEQEKLAKQRSECQGLCQGNCEGEGFCDKEGNCNGNKPGKGGISRGRGDANMTWGEESDEAGTKFKSVVLPPGMLDEPSEKILGMTKHAPEVDPAATAPRNSNRDNDPAAGRASWSRKVSPKHRETLQKYFRSASPKSDIPADEAI